MNHDSIIRGLKNEIKDLKVEAQSMAVRIHEPSEMCSSNAEEYLRRYRDRFDKAINSISEKEYIIEALNFYRRPNDRD